MRNYHSTHYDVDVESGGYSSICYDMLRSTCFSEFSEGREEFIENEGKKVFQLCNNDCNKFKIKKMMHLIL